MSAELPNATRFASLAGVSKIFLKNRGPNEGAVRPKMAHCRVQGAENFGAFVCDTRSILLEQRLMSATDEM